MPSYTITEPHPTVLKDSYTHSGRGGAGNFFRAPETTAPAGVPTPVSAPRATTARFYSGRGGAGNAHVTESRPALSFDEVFTLAETREKASSVTHIGRGGAGNVFHKPSSSSNDTKRRDSSDTDNSTKSGFWARLSNVGNH